MPGTRTAGAEPALFISAHMQDVETWSVAGGVAVVHSSRAPNRQANQDAALIISLDEESAVLAVADGVGGERGGARAAELAVTCLAASVRGRGETPLRTAVLDGFEAANRAVQEGGGGGMTTLAALAIERGAVRPYHVGDSAILLFGQRGKLKLQTVSHSPVGFALESGMLDEEEAMHHEDRHVVSNVLGSPDMRIEIGARRRLASRDTAVIASDGLFDNLHTDEIVERARRGSAEAAARSLVDEARRRMQPQTETHPSKPDDLTLVLFRPARAS